jgi:hypothetical protein
VTFDPRIDTAMHGDRSPLPIPAPPEGPPVASAVEFTIVTLPTPEEELPPPMPEPEPPPVAVTFEFTIVIFSTLEEEYPPPMPESN